MRPGRQDRGAFTLVEMLIAFGLGVMVLALIGFVVSYSNRSSGRISGTLSLQQGGRRAVVRMLRELQEGMEVLAPAPGHTLSHALVRDKVSAVRWFYLLPQSGKPGCFELWRFARDPDLPPDERVEKLVSDIKRLTFTSRSEGALQVNLTLAEDDKEFPVLCTVRLRNLASAEELW